LLPECCQRGIYLRQFEVGQSTALSYNQFGSG